MKSLLTHVLLTVTVGLIACGAVAAFGLHSGELVTAIIGALISTVVACIALGLKSQIAGNSAKGFQEMLTMQGITFAIRIAVVTLGGIACKRNDIDPIPFVLAFAACSLLQQAVEVKFLLSVRPAATSEVAS